MTEYHSDDVVQPQCGMDHVNHENMLLQLQDDR